MSEAERKDRLDAELRRAINTTTPQFDAKAWQHKYRSEFDTLLSRAGATHNQLTILRPRPAFWLGIAAAVVIVGYGLACWMESYRTQAPPPPARAKSPAQLVMMSSLSSAFRRGGMEALDKQLDDAVERLGPRPTGVSTARLLTDLGS
jgi:hypothetical protein